MSKGNPMEIEFLEDCAVGMRVDTCCFSGCFRSIRKEFKAGDRLACCEAIRGEKKKGGRDLHVLIDNGSLHPDDFYVPEKLVRVR